MSFLTAHKPELIAFAIAIIDFAMALSPKLKSNGIVHMVYLSLGGKDTSAA